MSLLFNAVAGLGFLLVPQAYSTMFPKEIKLAAAPYVEKKDVRTMKLILYLGFLIFGVSLFVPVVSGWTPLPRWACVFNILPLMLVLMPTRVGGSGNWAGAVMFLGLLLLI